MVVVYTEGKREGIREKDTDVEAREGLSVILHCPRGSLALFHPLIAVFILSLSLLSFRSAPVFLCVRARASAYVHNLVTTLL